MAEGRLARFAGGLGLGYLHTLAVLVVGLWLTPFLLRQLGSHDYGLWLLASQVLVYLALMDFGVVALVPREVAFAVGQRTAADGAEDACRSRPGGRGRSAARWPGRLADAGRRAGGRRGRVAGCRPSGSRCGGRSPSSPPGSSSRFRCGCSPRSCKGCRTWRSSAPSSSRRGSPGRPPPSCWRSPVSASTRSRPAGSCRSCCRRWSRGAAWRRDFRQRPPRATAAAARGVTRASRSDAARGSASTRSRRCCLSGTDLRGRRHAARPEAIVPYACTGKLMTMLANQPQLFMQMALPALSELRGSAARDRLFDVSRSMTQLMLLASGAIVAVVLVVNGPFVAWWVGGVAVRRPGAHGAAAGRHARRATST